MRSRVGVVAAVLVGSCVLAVPAAGAGDDLCVGFGAPEVAGAVDHPELIEISGLAGSRAHPGVLWTHNDSGGAPEVFAMGEDGADLGAHPVDGATATDWEDMEVGPGPEPDRSYLYLADIGDNVAGRDSVTVYRVPEPADAPTSAGGTLTGTETIELRYPDGASDAEALLVDPSTGDLLVVTKSYLGSSHVLLAPAASLVDGATVTMTDEATISIPAPDGQGLPGTAVTGGDVAPDGSIVLLRTYQSVLAYPRGEGQTVAEALQATPCFAPQVDEPQGEAVAFTGSGAAYVTVSEGANQPIHRVELSVPAPATTVPPTTTTTTVGDPPDDSSSDATLRIVLGAALVLGCVAALVLLVRRRRH